MSTRIRYELKFKIPDHPWTIFDTYKSKEDSSLIKYRDTYLRKGYKVKIIEVVTKSKMVFFSTGDDVAKNRVELMQ